MSQTGNRMERPQLQHVMDMLRSSERIVIYDGESRDCPELYKGFVACLKYAEKNIDKTRRVEAMELGTEIFRVDRRAQNKFYSTKELDEEVPVGNISDYTFYDLEMIIYQRIYLEAQTLTQENGGEK